MRLFILMLSISCVIAYGYALAGYIGYTFERGRMDYIIWGLSLGTFFGVAAMKLWRKWMPYYMLPEEKDEKEKHVVEEKSEEH